MPRSRVRRGRNRPSLGVSALRDFARRGFVASAVLALGSAPAAAAPPGAAPAERTDEPHEPGDEAAGEAASPRSVEIVEISVEGHDRVPESQIRAALSDAGLEAGTAVLWPDDERVQRARARLAATGYFSQATIRLEPVPGTRARARVIVQVRERTAIEVTDLHLGMSEMTPFRGGLQVIDRNFLGRSVHLGAGLIWGARPSEIPQSRNQQGYRVHMEAPRLGRSRVGLVGSAKFLAASEAFRVEGAADDPAPRHFRTVDYNRAGGRLGLTIPVTPQWQLGFDARFEIVDAELPVSPIWVTPSGDERSVDLELQPGAHRHSSVDLSLRWDGREDFAALGRGGRFRLDVQLASPAIGSEYEYLKVVLGGGYSFRLPWRHWITPRVLGGQVTGDAPRFERFVPGDLHDWTPGREMGLLYSTRGPVDVFGTGIDGHGLADIGGRVDVEYAIPLFRRVRTAAVSGGYFFFSTGIFAVAGDQDERRQRRDDGLMAAPIGFNANLGVRLETGLGLVDLSVGNVLERVPLP